MYLMECERLFDGERVLDEPHGVLVSGTKIEGIAPLEDFRGAPHPRRGGTGLTLLPGLIDCHVHVCFENGGFDAYGPQNHTDARVTLSAVTNCRDTLLSGITSVRDCGGWRSIEMEVRDACAQGRIIGPKIVACGHAICMTGGHGYDYCRVADGEQEMVKAAREQIHAGAEFIKLMATGGILTAGVNPEDAHYTVRELKAAIDEAKRFGKHSAAHAHGAGGALNAIRAGIDSIEHGTFMNDECIEALIEAEITMVPTLSAGAVFRKRSDIELPPELTDGVEEFAERQRWAFSKVYKSGGRIAMGSDAGSPYNYHGENVQELDYMVDWGMAPLDAMISATARAADLLRFEDRGRIKEGFIADILLVDGDPSTDISAICNRRNHHAVIKEGAWHGLNSKERHDELV